MFKLFHELLQNDFEEQGLEDFALLEDTCVTENSEIELSPAHPLALKIEQADLLWQQGKISEAINIYSQAIQQAPGASTDVYQKFIVHLNQHNNLAQAYEKVASALKKQGNNEDAVNYYRRALFNKSIIAEATHKYFESRYKSLICPEVVDIKDSAFSFQPKLGNYKSQTNHQANTIPPKTDKEENMSVASTSKLNETPKTFQIQWEATQTYMQKALEYVELQEWENVLIACQKATQIMPNMAEAYKIWGNALQKLNNTSEAMKCYSKAIEIQPDLAVIYVNLAQLYSQQQKWQQAIRYYQKAITIKPEFAQAYRELASAWEEFGQPDKAQAYNYRATELEANQLAITTKAKESASNSVMKYQKSVPTNIHDVTNSSRQDCRELANQNSLQQRQSSTTNIENLENIDQLIRQYYHQIKLTNNPAEIYLELGNLYSKKTQWKSAIACYNKAIRINSKYAEAYLNLAKALAKIGNKQKSADKMYLAFHLQPSLGSAEEHIELGEIFWSIGNRDRAIKCYQRAIKLEPNFWDAYEILGQRLDDLGQTKEATECYQQMIELNPSDADAYFRLGKQLMINQRWHHAVTAFRRVLKLHPQYPEASKMLNYALSEKLKWGHVAKSN